MLFTAPSHAHTAAGVKSNDQYGEQFVIMFNLFMVQLKQVRTYLLHRANLQVYETYDCTTCRPYLPVTLLPNNKL